MDQEISFGEWLRRRRRALDLTQDDLARRVGYSVSAIRKVEEDLRRPSREMVARLAEQLEVRAEERERLVRFARRGALGVSPIPPGEGSPRASLVPAPHRSDLATEPTPLIGRDREIEAIRALLSRDDVRLITLTGAPGIGKTSLGRHVLGEVAAQFVDGVCLVPLITVRDAELVPAALARALGLREGAGQPLLEGLRRYLHAKHFLLMLDNFEQIVDAAPVLAELLAGCPHLKILVTSRESLQVRGEHSFDVPPLSLPDPRSPLRPEDLLRSDAICLFVARAQAVRSDFKLTAENAASVSAICRGLDGLPLAIELAAARSRLLAPQAMLPHLADRFRLLVGGPRDLPAHQRALHTTLDWSHDLLDEDEKALFRRLSVFVGGCTVEAVGAVCQTANTLDLLESLVRKSLLRQEAPEGSEPRFAMLETIHEYARERLSEAGEVACTLDRHVAWCRALAQRAEPEMWGPASRIWLDRLEGDYANLRAALALCLDTDPDAGLRLAGSLWALWFLRGGLAEGQRWLEALLARAPAGSVARGKALLGAGFCCRHVSTLGQARCWTEQSLVLARATGDRRLAGWALHNLGCVSFRERDYGSAHMLLEESVAECRRAGDKVGEGMSLRDLGHLARVEGDFEGAAALHGESLAKLRPVGHRWNVLWTLLGIGDLARQQHDAGRARAAFRECLAIGREEKATGFIVYPLGALGALERSAGNLDAAEAYLKEGLAELKKLGAPEESVTCLYPCATLFLERGSHVRGVRLAAVASRDSLDPVRHLPEDVRDHDGALRASRAALGDAAFAAAWAEGRAMTLEQAIQYALSNDDGQSESGG